MAHTKKACVLIDKVYEDMELLYPYYRLLEAGFEVDVIGHEEAGTLYLGKNGYPFVSNLQAAKAKASDYACFVAPGGWAPDRLRRYDEILKLVADVYHQGGVVASICHGPWVLISAGIVKGKKLTSVKAIKDDLVNAGVSWVDQEVVVDQRIVTSRAPADLPAFMKAILIELGEQSPRN
jgi:protease I